MGHGIKFGIAAAGTLSLLTILSWSREPTAPGVASAAPSAVVSGGTVEAVADTVAEELAAAAPSSAELDSAAAAPSAETDPTVASPAAPPTPSANGESDIGCVLTEPAARAAAEAGRPNPGSVARPRSPWIKHSVKEAETLISIARRYLKDGSKWKEILDANPRLRGPEYLRTGMTLLIPNGSGAAPARPAAAAKPAAAAPTPALSVSSARPRTYKVTAGDTLSKIALKTLGAKKRWREVFEANRDRLASPDDVRVGQELVIPRG